MTTMTPYKRVTTFLAVATVAASFSLYGQICPSDSTHANTTVVNAGIVEFRFKKHGNNTLRLHVKNLTGKPLVFLSDIDEVFSQVFMDFPRKGCMQFRSMQGYTLRTSSERGMQCWVPAALDSSLDYRTPKVFTAHHFRPDEEKSFPVNLKAVLESASRNIWAENKNDGGYKGFFFLIKLPVTVQQGDQIKTYHVRSEYFSAADFCTLP